METRAYIMMAILILLILFGAIALMAKKKYKRPIDYYMFFLMGLVWLAIGLPSNNPSLWMMGLVFVVIGISHKDKWKENRLTWDKLSKEEKKLRFHIIGLLGVVLLAGVVVFILTDKTM